MSLPAEVAEDFGDALPPPRDPQDAPERTAPLSGRKSRRLDPADTPREVRLLQLKAELVKRVRGAVESVKGKGSVYARVNAKVRGISGDALGLLDVQPQKILEALENELIKPLESIDQALPRMQLKEIEAQESAFTNIMGRQGILEEPGLALCQAIDFLASENRQVQRRSTIQTKYRTDPEFKD